MVNLGVKDKGNERGCGVWEVSKGNSNPRETPGNVE